MRQNEISRKEYCIKDSKPLYRYLSVLHQNLNFYNCFSLKYYQMCVILIDLGRMTDSYEIFDDSLQ